MSDVTQFSPGSGSYRSYASAARGIQNAWRRYGPYARRAYGYARDHYDRNRYRAAQQRTASRHSAQQVARRRGTFSSMDTDNEATQSGSQPTQSSFRTAASKSYQGGKLPAGSRAIRARSRKALRDGVDAPLSLRNLTDILCPLVKIEFEAPHNEINWDANQQGYGMFNYLNRAELAELWGKVNSTDVINHPATILGIGSTTQASSIMKYTGGTVEYTIVNSCNHAVEVLVNTFKPRGRHSLTLYECWDLDLSNDDTLQNATVPLNIEKTKQDYGVPILQTANPNSYVKLKYAIVQSQRVVLAVGETYVYTVKAKPFTFDMARENMYNYGTTSPLYGPQMLSTSIICRSQLVVDSTGSKVAHGSGKIAVAEKTVSFSRSGLQQKRYQTIAHGGLDTIADGDQFHYNVDTEAENQFTTS